MLSEVDFKVYLFAYAYLSSADFFSKSTFLKNSLK